MEMVDISGFALISVEVAGVKTDFVAGLPKQPANDSRATGLNKKSPKKTSEIG